MARVDELPKLSSKELLTLHAKIANELRERGITRTANNPTGDLAEYLFCTAFGWARAGNSHPNVDAIGLDGLRFQIKARRMTKNRSRQLGAIRSLDGEHFDFLAGVLFDETYGVLRAALIPHATVKLRATYVAHTNSHKFMLHDDVWLAEDVRDVTPELAAIMI
jgi:hypothetical protein